MFRLPVNDVDGCYRYPDVVRFEIEEQNPDSYRRAAARSPNEAGRHNTQAPSRSAPGSEQTLAAME
jgi:hypothetical protein